MQPFQVICGWCETFMHGDTESIVVSHGICGPCSEAAMLEGGVKSRMDWIDREFYLETQGGW